MKTLCILNNENTKLKNILIACALSKKQSNIGFIHFKYL